jgi:hypothetical protein
MIFKESILSILKKKRFLRSNSIPDCEHSESKQQHDGFRVHSSTRLSSNVTFLVAAKPRGKEISMLQIIFSRTVLDNCRHLGMDSVRPHYAFASTAVLVSDQIQ